MHELEKFFEVGQIEINECQRLQYQQIISFLRYFSQNVLFVCRYLVQANPWVVMRILGETFGYTFSVTPMHGRIEAPTGDRRTCVWTLVSTKSNP